VCWSAVTMDRVIIHVDMDAFYASVEALDDPELAGRPVIVGGDAASRSVVSAASYEARRFGVHSAMPMSQAQRLCPEAIVRPVRMERYREVSQEIRGIFERYTPFIEPISIDEAFLDVSGSCWMWQGPEETGRAIKRDIRGETGLTASLGIAPNKFLAKLASDLEKPDGLVYITEENKQVILDPLPIRSIWGIGPKAEATLHRHGIFTIAELRRQSALFLRSFLGDTADDLLRFSCGIDDAPVVGPSQPKSVSVEETFAADLNDPQELQNVLFGQVEKVAARLRAQNLHARSIGVKFRLANFRTVCRSRPLNPATATTDILWQNVRSIFGEWREKCSDPLRLVGVAASSLVGAESDQGLLFSDATEKKLEALDRVSDDIRRRFGPNALKRNP